MANRNWANGGKLFAMHVQMVMVNAQISIGTAGAVGTVLGALISEVEHVSLGIYKIHLQNNFNSLISAQASMQSPASGLSGIMAIEMQNAPSDDVSDFSDPSLTIKCLDAAGSLADPANGSVIDLMSIMSNSSVNVSGSPAQE